jgi:iron complex transport system substrate-binding protein
MEKMSMENILMADPDVIVAMEPLFVKNIKQNPHFKNLRAVKNNKVYLVPSTPFNYITRPPSFMRLMGIRWLIHTFYPEILDISLEDEQKRFEKIFFKGM